MVRKFFSRLLPATIGALIGFFIVMMIVVGGLIGSISEAIDSIDTKTEIEDHSILNLTLDHSIVENHKFDPISKLNLSSLSPKEKIGLVQIKEVIKNAATDSKIDGILLNISDIKAGWSKIKEMREELIRFRECGKFVIAYSDVLSEKGYYLASASDEIYINPYGYVEFNGITSQKVFIKGMLGKLGIEPEVFKVGDFKSAVEPLLRESMSDSAKLQTQVFLESIQQTYFEDVSAQIDVNVDSLRVTMNNFSVRKGSDAFNKELITKDMYLDQVEDEIRDKMNLTGSDKINYVGLNKYRSSFKIIKNHRSKIAVIIAEGEIVGGKGDQDQIGSTNLVNQIRKARSNDSVKAIVLRINSPGGSALASEIIWRELQLIDDKPVIASMSDVAASGGYYIATGCDSIVANKNTITGSIGVFGILFNFNDFLNDKLGVTTDQVKTGRFSDFGTGTRALTQDERKIMQSEVQDIYDLFLKRVADARGLSLATVNNIARGRVYTGIDAKKIDLVDRIGELQDAVNMAQELADVDSDNCDVIYYPKQKQFLEKIMETMDPDAQTKFDTSLEEILPYLKSLKSLSKKENSIQTRMPYDLIIE